VPFYGPCQEQYARSAKKPMSNRCSKRRPNFAKIDQVDASLPLTHFESPAAITVSRIASSEWLALCFGKLSFSSVDQ
jgi:hypothetical protein